jgi:hypothetical protein
VKFSDWIGGCGSAWIFSLIGFFQFLFVTPWEFFFCDTEYQIRSELVSVEYEKKNRPPPDLSCIGIDLPFHSRSWPIERIAKKKKDQIAPASGSQRWTDPISRTARLCAWARIVPAVA